MCEGTSLSGWPSCLSNPAPVARDFHDATASCEGSAQTAGCRALCTASHSRSAAGSSVALPVGSTAARRRACAPSLWEGPSEELPQLRLFALLCRLDGSTVCASVLSEGQIAADSDGLCFLHRDLNMGKLPLLAR